MQLYFVKATYTNNVYKLSDFFLSGDYKKVATKMLNINFQASDGRSSFITSKLTLPDSSSIREHTHVIVPDYEKIYKIEAIQYLNKDQYEVYLIDDPLIGSYLDLETEDIVLQRSNDPDLFRGVNDIADLSLKETVETVTMNSDWRTGKWALLFFQLPTPISASSEVGMEFDNTGIVNDYEATTLALLRVQYPEVDTDSPEEYEYFQKIAYIPTVGYYQCVYDGSSTNSRLLWVDYNPSTVVSFNIHVPVVGNSTKQNQSDVVTICIALPFETDLYNSVTSQYILSYDRFIGPIGTDLIDVKIINDWLILKENSINYTLSGTTMTKAITLQKGSGIITTCYVDASLSTASSLDVVILNNFDNISLLGNSFVSGGAFNPLNAEPFYKYELYIYGSRVSIPYYLTDKIYLMVAITSGICNWIVYYNEKRNIIASGSFTHSIRYQIDQLTAFYAENPTYKDQYYLKMSGNLIKAPLGGAVGGAVAGGPVGAVVGGTIGAVTALVDAGLSYANLKFMEKGLRLKPDQINGEISEIALQLVNMMGIYWVKRTAENADLMRNEYEFKGFPTSYVESIDDLDYATSTLFGTSKVVFGEIKTVIKNEFTTNEINKKLKQGIVLVP